MVATNVFEEMIYKYENVFRKAVIVFFIIFLLVGCYVFSDYGISTDEEVQRYSIGELNYNFIGTQNNSDQFLQNYDKYHGPAFELFLYSMEKVFQVKDSRDIYLLRHFLTFLTFYVAAIVFYLLCLKVFRYHVVALLGVIMLVVCPRIFAESFYNSKDLPLLCFYIFGTYTMLVFIERQTIASAVIHAVCCGVAIDIRIMGVMIPIITVCLFLFNKKKKIVPFVIFIVYCIVSIILLWPVLWLGPIHHFIQAFKQMSNYPVGGTNLYMGKFVSMQTTPWHYLPVWIGITTPVCYILLFLTGVVFTIKNAVFSFKTTLLNQVFLCVFVAPIVAVIVLNSTVYDAWRHVYFIYPFFVLVALYGFVKLVQLAKNKIVVYGICLGLLLSILFTGCFMIKYHPFQNVYFNSLAGNNIREKYDMDYWGLSFRKALEYILEHDTSPLIRITSDNSDVYLTSLTNFKILPEADRNRLVFEYSRNKADYFVTNFRWHPSDYSFGTSVYQIKVQNETIMEVLKLR